MNFLQHIKAVYAVLALVAAGSVSAAEGVERASWHICLANGFVAHGWGLGRDGLNEVYAMMLRGARKRLLAVADRSGTREKYNGLWTLWLHWRLPARAPKVVGLRSVSVHWGEGEVE